MATIPLDVTVCVYAHLGAARVSREPMKSINFHFHRAKMSKHFSLMKLYMLESS